MCIRDRSTGCRTGKNKHLLSKRHKILISVVIENALKFHRWFQPGPVRKVPSAAWLTAIATLVFKGTDFDSGADVLKERRKCWPVYIMISVMPVTARSETPAWEYAA